MKCLKSLVMIVVAVLCLKPEVVAGETVAYRDLQIGAAYHLQVKVANISGPHSYYGVGYCEINGVVVRAFRNVVGGDILNSTVSFDVPCHLPSATSDLLPLGVKKFMSLDQLVSKPFVEVFLNPAQNGYSLADFGAGLTMLSQPSEKPFKDIR